jgi:hypothetical protein
MRFLTTFGLLTAGFFCVWVASAAPDQEAPEPQPRKEVPQMIDAAQKAYEASLALWSVGAGGVTFESVYTWSRRWADAQADGADRGKQVKAYMAHRDRMNSLHDFVKKKSEIGAAGGERDKYEAAKYYAAEAEHLLLKLPAAPK